jgi:hypothetical protein
MTAALTARVFSGHVQGTVPGHVSAGHVQGTVPRPWHEGTWSR